MFWKPKEPESVDPAALEALAKRVFDSRLGWLESRGSRITKELSSAERTFMHACDSLDMVTAEPVTENLFRVKPESIRLQKSGYVTALRSAFVHPAYGDTTIHGRYSAELSALESSINKVLTTNAQFKFVLVGYASHIGQLKESFSRIEQLRNELKRELERADSELAIYNGIMPTIERLAALAEEEKQITAQMSGVASGREESVAEREAGLKAAIKEKQSERDKVSAEASAAKSSVELVLSPLERAARKYDHLVAQKTRLSEFIERPLELITDGPGYAEFRGKLNDLKGWINAGKVDVRDARDTASRIESILGQDLRAQAIAAKGLSAKKAVIDEELISLHQTMESVSAIGKKHRDKEAALSRMDEQLKSIAQQRPAIRSQIEQRFLSDYKMRIRIS